MRLIRVYSNKSSFKTTEFNNAGLSFILAKQKNIADPSVGATYNGVGKSLLVKIIHFCLGANKKNYQDFSEKLNDWEFYLDFEVDTIKYTTKRQASNPERIYLNEEEMTITKFNKYMETLVFDIPNGIKNLSFRTLLPFFIRSNRDSYVTYDKPSKSFTPYQTLLQNSFLLGLDSNSIQNKKDLKLEKNRINDLEANFKKDNLLKEYFTGNRDVKLAIIDLEEKISSLEKNMSDYKVAEDYNEIQSKANLIENNVFDLKNEIILLKNNIKNINKSLTFSPDLKKEFIMNVYEEANFYFPKEVTKSLEEIEAFYEKLVKNRKMRLVNQKSDILRDIENHEKKLKHEQEQLNSHLKYLGEHQALDIFLALNTKISDLKSEKEKLLKYQNLQSEYKELIRNADKEIIELEQKADSYLNSIKEELNELIYYFRNLAKRFYPNSISGLHIGTNDGDNQLLFNIEAKIESDTSDGINNVKIFCYDLTVLKKGHNHSINFIFHDSRLYDGIDQRQKAEIFRVLYDEFNNSNYQYIATINQNQLDEIKKILNTEDYEKIITNNTILTLTDEDDAEKLLGIKVDLND